MTGTDEDVAIFYVEVGRRVRRMRLAGQPPWTQEQLARRVGLTRSSVANLEAGNQRVPLHTLIQVAQVLGVPVVELIPVEPPTIGKLAFRLTDDLPQSSRDFILACLAGLPGLEQVDL